MPGKIILVTGANGLLGRQVVRRLSPDHEVHAAVRRLPEQRIAGVKYHELDLSAAGLAASLPSRLDTVVHLAQSSRFRDFPDGALDVFSVNVASTAHLLDHACRSGASQFLYASSGGVYGTGGVPFTEDSPYAPAPRLGHYLASKVAGELLVQSYLRQLQVLVLRFFFIYGAGQDRTMLMPRLANNIRAGRPVTIRGADGLRINPIHASDAAAALASALQTDSSATFNVAGTEVVSLRALCELMAQRAGRPAVFQNEAGEPGDVLADTAAMREKLWTPAVGLADGVADLFE